MFKIYMLDKGISKFVASVGTLPVAIQQADEFSLANGDCFTYVEECKVVFDTLANSRIRSEMNSAKLALAAEYGKTSIIGDNDGPYKD